MSRKFRDFHLLEIFREYAKQTTPLDLFLRNYFKLHHSIGAQDRKFLSETIYGMIRWQGLLDYFGEKNPTWEGRYQIFQTLHPESYLENLEIPLHIRCSFPLKYFTILKDSLGEESAKRFCLESNYPAPVTIRVNALKGSREELSARWGSQYNTTPGTHSPWALHFPKRINLFGLPEFKEGWFECQDEASQLVAFLVKAKPGDHVLDYCSGSGGKTLAFAPQMQNRGQIYLHDIRSHALQEAKKRLKRAGIQNAQLIPYEDPKKSLLKNRMDWVLTDVPCSGSGTLRRNPDMKWKFDPESFLSLTQQQRAIFSEALSFVKPKGYIVYATCSVLPQENREQCQYFSANLPVQMIGTPFESFPSRGSMDGFFAAVFQKI